MATYMMVNGKMEKEVVKALYIRKMAMYTKDPGKMIKHMVLVEWLIIMGMCNFYYRILFYYSTNKLLLYFRY